MSLLTELATHFLVVGLLMCCSYRVFLDSVDVWWPKSKNLRAAMVCARIEITSGDHRPDAQAFYEATGYFQDCRRFIRDRPA